LKRAYRVSTRVCEMLVTKLNVFSIRSKTSIRGYKISVMRFKMSVTECKTFERWFKVLTTK